MLLYQYTFFCVWVYVSCSECFSVNLIPQIARPHFESAWSAVTELSQAETVEDIDLHSIPYGKEAVCTACSLTVDFLILSHKYYVPDEVIKTALVALCSLILSNSVCQGILDLNMPILIEIANRKVDLRAEHVCGTVLEEFCAKKPLVDWNIHVPDQIIMAREKKDEKEENDDLIKVAHVTDTHIDEKYTAGAVAKDCREPICCRGYQGQPSSSTNSAGLWGDYTTCDIPWSTAENLLNTLATNHKDITYVYMTGDLIAHNIWETTKEDNIRQIRDQAAYFYKILGDDVKIFPVLGNHEPHPANVLAPPGTEGFSAEWLYEAFYDAWCNHFPRETKSLFMRGGYYSVSPTPGFRIVGLNSLFGYVFNWWMILDPVDPGGQLKWLSETLLEAEAKQEKVHILMHGPSAETDTLQVWKREYNKLIDRFKSTVVGQFLGHTHRDQFYVHYSPQTMEPVGVAWNGGSVTPFTNVNPNYKIYSVNKHTLEVEDIDTYTYNLTKANQAPKTPPNWVKLYSFKQAYRVSSLGPKNIDLLAKKMAEDDQLFSKYILHYMKNSDKAIEKGCDKKCKEKQLCKIVSGASNATYCKNILQNVQEYN